MYEFKYLYIHYFQTKKISKQIMKYLQKKKFSWGKHGDYNPPSPPQCLDFKILEHSLWLKVIIPYQYKLWGWGDKRQTAKHTNIPTYRHNRPKGQLSEKRSMKKQVLLYSQVD